MRSGIELSQFLRNVLPTFLYSLVQYVILYITFLMLFLVIFERNKMIFYPGKIFLLGDKIIPFENYNAP